MGEIKWIKVNTDIFDNRKIRQIEAMPDGDTLIVIWVKLLCLAGITNDSGLIYITPDVPYTEQMLVNEFNRPMATIHLALNTFMQFGMIDIADDILHVSNWERYQNVDRMEKIRAQTRARVAAFRERKKIGNVTNRYVVTQSNETDKEEDKDIDKDIYINIYKNKNNNTLGDFDEQKKEKYQDLDQFFDDLWKLYPRKKGKGSVSERQKKRLYDIGADQMTRAIERFKADNAGQEERFIPYGSTFFNSAYVDYLDENYVSGSENAVEGTEDDGLQ